MSRSRQRQPQWGERGNYSYECFLADKRPTCQMTVEEHPDDSPFKSDHGRLHPENLGMERATVGQQRGTFFKTSIVRHHPIWGEMTVWHWGGVHPVDLANGVSAH